MSGYKNIGFLGDRFGRGCTRKTLVSHSVNSNRISSVIAVTLYLALDPRLVKCGDTTKEKEKKRVREVNLLRDAEECCERLNPLQQERSRLSAHYGMWKHRRHFEETKSKSEFSHGYIERDPNTNLVLNRMRRLLRVGKVFFCAFLTSRTLRRTHVDPRTE